jgi:predicted Zn-dependent protease
MTDMNAHEKLEVVMDRVRPIFCANSLGEIYDFLEIWLVDDHKYIASIRGKRIEIKTFFAWILKEGGVSFIIGHETYHFIKAIENQKSDSWGTLFDRTVDQAKTPLGKIVVAITAAAIMFPFSRLISREEEFEADLFGKKITLEAGYPLSDIGHLFSIQEMKFAKGGGFLDTHPDTGEREKRLGLTRY